MRPEIQQNALTLQSVRATVPRRTSMVFVRTKLPSRKTSQRQLALSLFICMLTRPSTQDFKMPVWMPGYNRIMDYSKDVVNYHAADEKGHALPWTKIDKNIWRVKIFDGAHVVIGYDIYGFTRFVANNYLDDQRGYFVGPAMYLYTPGMIDRPAVVHFKLPAGWSSISNGLDPVPG